MRSALFLILLTLPTLGVAAPGASAQAAEVRDVALMLEDGPLHLRLRITLGGKSLNELRAGYVDRLIASLDRDGDGTVSRVEARATPLLAARRREKANAFLASLDEGRSVPRSEIETSVIRVGGEPVVYRQDESAAQNDIEVFRLLDTDGSGLVEPEEMTTAALRILGRDVDRDECVTFQEFLPVPEVPTMPVFALASDRDEGPRPTVADRLRDAAEPLLPRRLAARYDKDRDGKLSPAELGWTAARVALLDADKDGTLSLAELRFFGRTAVDLELAIELDPGDGRALNVTAVTGTRLDDRTRPDFARFKVGNATLTISHRGHDPVAAAVTNALREFNAMDIDANGYLDAEEASVRTRFERGLFDTIDTDADGKVFANEMEQYVRLRAEPSATSCQVNLYDTGRGFFQVLDANGDGRISVREMRTAEASLKKARKAESGPLTVNDPARSFHIEFVRGEYQLFGRTELMTAQSPSFVSVPAAGPVWFRRMDRNNDGDLTWNEFLGPRLVYQQLDADGDGLIDANEALAAQ